jgi:hypothetical protein
MRNTYLTLDSVICRATAGVYILHSSSNTDTLSYELGHW